MKKLKTIKVNIRANDTSLIGKRFVFQHHSKGEIIGVIIAVTKDRVIWIDEDNKEDWTWRSLNGNDVSFDILNDGRNGHKFIKAVTLENKVKQMRKDYKKLHEKYLKLKRFEEQLKIFKQFQDKVYMDEEHD